MKTYRFDDQSVPLCLSVTKDAVVLGCTNGVIRLYDKAEMQVRCRLPHPAFIGMDPAVASTAELLEIHPKGVNYPDVRALCSTSSAPESFIAAYSDRSMFVFERGDNFEQWKKLSSSMAHVGAVTVVKRYPSQFPSCQMAPSSRPVSMALSEYGAWSGNATGYARCPARTYCHLR